MLVTNAYTESINRLANDKNREGCGYSFEVIPARMFYNHKTQEEGPIPKVSPLYKKSIDYGLSNFVEKLNYEVDLTTIGGWYQVDEMKAPHQPLNPYTH